MSCCGKGSRERPACGGGTSDRPSRSANLRGRRFLPLLAAAFATFHAFAQDESETPIRIEPDVDVVPANHLKFYLHFPEPMERGDVFRFLRLVEIDEDGNEVSEVPEPFREVELWDETFTRMTLWFHPGRQKPGVNLNVEIGPILEEGKRYRLEISGEWNTEDGYGLERPLTHEFVAGPMDSKQPDPKNWKLGRTKSSFGKFTAAIDTGEPLDPESVRKRIRIFLDGDEVDFRYSVDAIFFGADRGSSAHAKVLIDPRVEDLAGNSVARPFNLDLQENSGFNEETDIIELSFQLPKFSP